MELKKLKTKGETMIEKVESQFWVYNTNNKHSQQNSILLDNVQFIYELSLAELELKVLGVEFEVTNSLREFKLLNKSNELKININLSAPKTN